MPDERLMHAHVALFASRQTLQRRPSKQRGHDATRRFLSGLQRRPGWYADCRKSRMNAAATNAELPLLRPPHYQRIGGDEGVVRLVAAFYRHMDTQPGARTIRAMHEADLRATQAVLVLYLREWLGGPKDYSAQRGHPRLRMRHAGFPIDSAARDAWLGCMRAALSEVGAPQDLQAELMAAFFKTADWMRNRPDGAAAG